MKRRELRPWFLLVASLVSGCSYSFAVQKVEKICDDGQDGDGDGLTDCDDPDCVLASPCLTESVCDDGLDNDRDDLTDCDDPDCANATACRGEDDCSNGRDDDGDGKTDCEDSECADSVPCMGPYGCDHDGVCECFAGDCESTDASLQDRLPWEDRRWCDDCQVQCELGQGSKYEYIATQVQVIPDATDNRPIGFDLDGNGSLDNGFGHVLQLLQTYNSDPETPNDTIRADIQDGRLIVLFRLYVDSFPDDQAVAVQVFGGDTDTTLDATEDNLTGSGEVLRSSASDPREKICGALDAGQLLAGPGRITVPMPVFRTLEYIPLDPAWVFTEDTGYVTASEARDLVVAGGVSQELVDTKILPDAALYLNERFREEPDSNFAQNVLRFVDANCSSDPKLGCQDVRNGEGDCSPWSGDLNEDVVTPTELKCNNILGTLFSADTMVETSDGTALVYTMAVRINAAVHVTIRN